MRHLLLLLLVLGLASAVACKTASYKTLRTVATGVDAALKVYGDAYQSGKITPAQRTKIKAAHVKYQAAMNTAIAAARLDYDKPAPPELVSLATSLISTINTFTGKATP
tara:strand:+ start:1870 stop:2196 length:327 start_codon:yes stop_codon:yes gene_type:complete